MAHDTGILSVVASRHMCLFAAQCRGVNLLTLCTLQEHYCVAIGVNDATGAFQHFGFHKSSSRAGH